MSLTKKTDIRDSDEKVVEIEMEASDEEFDTEEVRKLVKRLGCGFGEHCKRFIECGAKG